MDAPDVDPRELERSLSDLQHVNRWLGGRRTALQPLAAMLRRLPRGRPYRVLDVASGAADIPRDVVRWGRRHGYALHVVAADLHAGTLAVARRQTADEPAISVLAADARALPLPDGAVDFALCSTALHHFDEPDAVRVLRELGRVARRGVVVNDLLRSWLGVVGVHLLAATLWRGHPVTRHDGPLSLRRSYTAPELRALARRAGLCEARVRRHALWSRLSLVVDRTAAAP